MEGLKLAKQGTSAPVHIDQTKPKRTNKGKSKLKKKKKKKGDKIINKEEHEAKHHGYGLQSGG
jgi:hypothetical protein